MKWEMWGILVPILAGLLGYFGKKYVDLKIDRALSGQLEVLRKAQTDRFEVVVRLTGLLTEIHHCVNHIKDGHDSYRERCRELCMKLRQDARASVALIGNGPLIQITTVSDIAIGYAAGPTQELHERWTGSLLEAMDILRSNLKAIGYEVK
jgi:hypothetical protein